MKLQDLRQHLLKGLDVKLENRMYDSLGAPMDRRWECALFSHDKGLATRYFFGRSMDPEEAIAEAYAKLEMEEERCGGSVRW